MLTKINDNHYQLYLLRHGKASSENNCSDFDRSLTDTGLDQAEKIGQWMSTHDLKPDSVLTSPAKRALMTTEIVSRRLTIDPKNIHIAPQMYQANLDTLLKVLAGCSPLNHKVLLVGHNPSLEYLVDYLVSASITHELANDDRLFPATLVCVEMNVDWSQFKPYCAQLLSITHGKFLP
ncbi:MAG: phosphohistidine phosphatase [Methylophagaceae bacterium]